MFFTEGTRQGLKLQEREREREKEEREKRVKEREREKDIEKKREREIKSKRQIERERGRKRELILNEKKITIFCKIAGITDFWILRLKNHIKRRHFRSLDNI